MPDPELIKRADSLLANAYAPAGFISKNGRLT